MLLIRETLKGAVLSQMVHLLGHWWGPTFPPLVPVPLPSPLQTPAWHTHLAPHTFSTSPLLSLMAGTGQEPRKPWRPSLS